jgi:hypothetical protein
MSETTGGGAAAPAPISHDAFRAMLADPRVPDKEIARYLTGSPGQSRPFDPMLRPDPVLVEIPPTVELATRAAGAMRALNDVARWRRRRRFEAAAPDDPRPVLLAEGDSWFQFPFMQDDVVDQLGARFRIRCLSAAGDTLRNMAVENPEYLETLEDQAALPGLRAFLFSGAGNDFLGEEDGQSLLAQVVRPRSTGLSAEAYIDTPALRERLDFVRDALRTLLRTVQQVRPGLRVVLHGYDYAFPFGGPQEARGKVAYARQDQWIAGPLGVHRGAHEYDTQRGIVVALVDRLNGLLASLCGGNTAGGEFAHAWHADLRGTLTRPSDYADELHPRDAGFRTVAAKIAALV